MPFQFYLFVFYLHLLVVFVTLLQCGNCTIILPGKKVNLQFIKPLHHLSPPYSVQFKYPYRLRVDHTIPIVCTFRLCCIKLKHHLCFIFSSIVLSSTRHFCCLLMTFWNPFFHAVTTFHQRDIGEEWIYCSSCQ